MNFRHAKDKVSAPENRTLESDTSRPLISKIFIVNLPEVCSIN